MEFALQTNGGYDSVLDEALWAEQQGFVSFGLPDHYVISLGEDGATVPAFDPFPHLAGLARETEHIELGVYVSPITFRHPAVLLKNAVGIDHMSGGRFTLGVGTGWMDREHEVFGIAYPDFSTRFAMLEDALGYLRAALSPGAVGHGGPFYRLEAVDIGPPPAGRLPLAVGGRGNVKTPRLAGMFADEYNVYPGTEAEVRARIERCRAAAEQAGRDPASILISSAGAVLTAPTEREYREKFLARAREGGVEPEELEAYFESRSTPRGTHEQLVEQLAVLAGLGVTRFHLQRGSGFDKDEEAALLAYLRSEIG